MDMDIEPRQTDSPSEEAFLLGAMKPETRNPKLEALNIAVEAWLCFEPTLRKAILQTPPTLRATTAFTLSC